MAIRRDVTGIRRGSNRGSEYLATGYQPRVDLAKPNAAALIRSDDSKSRKWPTVIKSSCEDKKGFNSWAKATNRAKEKRPRRYRGRSSRLKFGRVRKSASVACVVLAVTVAGFVFASLSNPASFANDSHCGLQFDGGKPANVAGVFAFDTILSRQLSP